MLLHKSASIPTGSDYLHQLKYFESVMECFIIRGKDRKKQPPVHFAAFDVLYVDGEPVVNKPLYKRLDLLQAIVIPNNAISVVPSYDDGKQLFKQVKQLELEGIVSKKRDSKYKLDSRSYDWLKIKNYLYETVSIAAVRKNDFGWSVVKDGRCYMTVNKFLIL